MRILDLGCGDGLTPDKLHLPADWQITGLDIKIASLAKARRNFPQRRFVCSAAEKLPFAACTFDQVISNVALPYTDIALAVAEAHRVLAPGGRLLASLHSLNFTFGDLRRSFPNPKAMLSRSWVLANGVVFHIVGRNFAEAFQTERGIRIAFQRANFTNISFWRDSKRWFVEATKPTEAAAFPSSVRPTAATPAA
jgi:SAM-dependent methyltransferase